MNKNLYKTILLVFSLAAIIFLITVSCKTVPTETIGSETTATETTTAVTTSETTSAETTSTETTAQESTTETTSSETTSTTTTTTTNQDANLTQQQAIDIALTVAAGTVERVETEVEHGKLIWKVRIVSGGTRTDIRIDDATGKVVEVKTSDD